MITNEFSRPFDLRSLGNHPVVLTSTETERAALAERFGIVAVNSLEAELTLDPEGTTINATGTLKADIVQSCAVSGEDLPVTVDTKLVLRFVPAQTIEEEELELDESDCDEIPFDGEVIDLGEAVAQSLALAIDPYAVGPDAEAARKRAGILSEDQAGPFAALAALKKD